VPILGALPSGTPVAFEAAYGWGWLVELLEELELEPHLVHPSRCKVIASARLKNDKVDAATLAQLLRAELLPEAWIAPQQVRDLRDLLGAPGGPGAAVDLVQEPDPCGAGRPWDRRGSHLEDRILWTGSGRAWLATLNLSPSPPMVVEDCCGLLDALATPIARLEREITGLAKPDPRSRR
jgi:transposase